MLMSIQSLYKHILSSKSLNMDTTQLLEGLHHVTATVNEAQEDYDFYTKFLGLRLVKKTVNFDNNQVYHFYYGNKQGEPGSIMTTFPYKGQGVRTGTHGTGQVKVTGFSVPSQSFDFWKNRFEQANISWKELTKFGKTVLEFKDPAGLNLELTGDDTDAREPWTTDEISEAVAIRGFHSVALSIEQVASTFDFLVDVLGAKKIAEEGRITRFMIGEKGEAHYLDISNDYDAPIGKNGIGTVHHVAWRIADEDKLKALRHHLVEELNVKVTEVKDRNYFRSIYFRIPGNVLFEVATIPPGFAIDETEEELGQALKLPEWEEVNRTHIENVLPKIEY